MHVPPFYEGIYMRMYVCTPVPLKGNTCRVQGGERQRGRQREREREREREITARGLSRCFCPCTDYADISARARCRRSDSLNCTLETLLDHSGEDEGRSWFSHDPSMSRKSEKKTSAEKRRMRSRRQSRVARRSSFLLRSPFKHAVVFRIR